MQTLLRLPFDLFEDRGLRQLTRRAQVPHRHFELSGPERGFVRALLTRPRFWTWRCNQRAYCGDFVIVDMSEPRPDRRRALVVELKTRSPLRRDSPGIQMARAHQVTRELADRRIVGARRTLLRGTADAVLASL